MSAPTAIHPSAVVDPGAMLGEGVRIGPFAYVGPEVEIGDGTVIGPHCSVTGPTRIGRDNHFVGHAAIGGDPQDKKFKGERVELVIGDRNQVREFVTVNRGTGTGGGITRVGSDQVQTVDVLRDHRAQLAPLLEAHECTVGARRLRCACEPREAALPRGAAHLLVGEIVTQGRRLLCGGILRPNAVRTAKIGDSRRGGDARSGEHGDPPCGGEDDFGSRECVRVVECHGGTSVPPATARSIVPRGGSR